MRHSLCPHCVVLTVSYSENRRADITGPVNTALWDFKTSSDDLCPGHLEAPGSGRFAAELWRIVSFEKLLCY